MSPYWMSAPIEDDYGTRCRPASPSAASRAEVVERGQREDEDEPRERAGQGASSRVGLGHARDSSTRSAEEPPRAEASRERG